jgi:hypothetical protein
MKKNSFYSSLAHSDKTSELYYYLTSNYNKNVRPVRNNSDVVNVKLGLKLIQIADIVCNTHSIFARIVVSSFLYISLYNIMELLEGEKI